VVMWLLAHGADCTVRNRRGESAADIGRRHGRILRLLSTRG
jgi:hypothetical protein